MKFRGLVNHLWTRWWQHSCFFPSCLWVCVSFFLLLRTIGCLQPICKNMCCCINTTYCGMLLPLPSKPNTRVIYTHVICLKGSIKMCQTSFWDAATQIRFLACVLFMSICVAFKVFMIQLQISLSMIMFCQASAITTQKYAVLLTTFAKDVSLYAFVFSL